MTGSVSRINDAAPMPEPRAPRHEVSGSVDDSDLLNRLTILQWNTAAELAKEIVEQQLRALEHAGLVERRPRQEPWGYGAAEFRLADNGRPREPSGPLWSPHRHPSGGRVTSGSS